MQTPAPRLASPSWRCPRCCSFVMGLDRRRLVLIPVFLVWLLSSGTTVSSAQSPLRYLPSTNGTVNAVAASGGTIYIGGSFTMVGASARNNIAAIDAATGNVKAWNPNANGAVFALALDG